MRAIQSLFFVAVLASPAWLRAQTAEPLPPLPPPEPSSAPPAPSGAAPEAPAPAPAPALPPAGPVYAPTYGPSYAGDQPPPRYDYTPPPPPKHAPRFSLWTGATLGLLGFGGSFFENELARRETTGNFIGNGITGEVDVGARLAKRYIPFVFWEHGFAAPGHRLEGTDGSASTDLMGLGFRYAAGNVDSVDFLSELSIGYRTVRVKDGSSTLTMHAVEYFRLGLGAEIRLSTLFVLSPMAHLSGGAMDDSSGDVTYGPNGSGDGVTHPRRDLIDGSAGYVTVGIGCGAHFDVFGE